MYNNYGITATKSDICISNEPICQWLPSEEKLTIKSTVKVEMDKHVIMPTIEGVVFQKTHTIVIWSDKTRTVINCAEEEFDQEKGLAMAITKKFMSRGEFKRLLKNALQQDV